MNINLREVIQIILVFQILIFSFFLFFKRKNNLAGILLGVHLFSQAMGVMGELFNLNYYLFENYTHFTLTGFPFMFLWGPTFYFYVKAFAFYNYKLKWKHLLHIVPFLSMVIYLSAVFYFHNAEVKKELVWSLLIVKNAFGFGIFLSIQLLFYDIASLHVLKIYSDRLKQNFSSIEKLNLTWLKFIVIYFVLADLSSYLYYLPFFPSLVSGNDFSIILYLIYLVFFNIIFFKSWSRQDSFIRIEDTTKYKSSNLSKAEAEKLIEKLNNHIKINKPFLKPELTINQLAEDINISPRVLSQIVNEYFNQNFYDYISSLRIEEAKRIFSEEGNKKTILEVIYGIGYNSKSAFNAAFKKNTGLTPSEFRGRIKSNSVVDPVT